MGQGAFNRARKRAKDEAAKNAAVSKSELKRIAALTDYQNKPDSMAASVKDIKSDLLDFYINSLPEEIDKPKRGRRKKSEVQEAEAELKRDE